MFKRGGDSGQKAAFVQQGKREGAKGPAKKGRNKIKQDTKGRRAQARPRF